MKEPYVIDRDWLENSIKLDADLLEVIEDAFVVLARDKVTIPAIQQIPLSEVGAQVCVKSAYVAEFPYFVVKIAGHFPQNSRMGEAGNQGCLCLFDSTTGKLDSLLADNGLLTQLRTAASGAIAAKYLAPNSVRNVAIIGAGVQAKLQLKALALVRGFDQVNVFSRTQAKSTAFVEWVKSDFKVNAQVSESAAEAVTDCQVIITSTHATNHLIETAQLDLTKPIHITAMGSDAPHKNELAPDLYATASRYVCDLKSQSLQLGELRTVQANGEQDFAKVEEIGEICWHQKRRAESDRLTICDLTGVGILDLKIAMHAKAVFMAAKQ